MSQLAAGQHASAEEAISAIWADLLGRVHVGPEESFFDLGGDSLLATQAMARLRAALERDISLRLLFLNPTVSGLARAVEEAAAEPQAAAPALERRDPSAPAPLSLDQERLWLLDQLEPTSRAHTELIALRLAGELDRPALARALAALARRHDVLRTSFPAVEGRPYQRIHDEPGHELRLIELTDVPADRRDEEARRIIEIEAARPFALETEPPLRFALLRLDEREHVLLLFMHHIVSDGWSVGVMLAELAALYRAGLAGEEAALPELRVQYADYAVWQRRLLDGPQLAPQLDYWRSELADVPRLELPTDRPRPPEQTFAGAEHRFVLGRQLRDRLVELGREEGVTIFMLLLAGFQALLARYSGQPDVAVGSPVAGRGRPDLEALIGFFVNMIVFRGDLSGDPTFRELLARTREKALVDYANQEVPFSRVVQELRIERDLSRTPLFQTAFVLQNTPLAEPDFQGLDVRVYEVLRQHVEWDLELVVWEGEPELVSYLQYNTDLFDAATAERMARHYVALLDAATRAPDARLSELDVLSDAERQAIVAHWNDTRVDFPGERCLHEFVEEQVERSPGAVAVVEDGRSLTYGELDRRANQLAHRLRALGVEPDVPVGVHVDRSLELVVALLGVLKAGGAYLPLDVDAPPARLAQLLEDAGAPVCLTQPHLAGELSDTCAVVALDLDSDALDAFPAHRPEAGVRSGNLVSIYYTSGSTGKPKGVASTHRGWVNRMWWMQRQHELTAADTVLQKTVLSFDDAAVEFFWPLLVGGTIAMLAPGEHRDPHAILAAAIRHRVAVLQFVPSMLSQFLVAVTRGAVEQLRALRHVVSSGEALRPELVRLFFERLGPVGCKLHNQWGATEVSIDSTLHTCSSSDAEARSVPVGRPIANNQVYVLDRWLAPTPIGVPGEIYLGGDGLARGYQNAPGLTAAVFVPSPFAPGERMYRTGDRGRYRVDGTIEFVDRVDHQVKIRGVRVEPGEVEAVLLTHEAVREAAVVARDDRSDGKRLVAYVAGDEGNAPGQSELHGFLSKRLPPSMIPAAFVPLPALPRTANGKLDRRALPAPADSRPDLETPYRGPRDARELVLAAIWAEALGVDRVGVDDNFFELGGDSILSLQVLAQARKRGLDLTVRQVFQTQTVAGLASVAGEIAGAEEGAAVARARRSAHDDGKLPLQGEDVEDVYGLGPFQQTILAECLRSRERSLWVSPAEGLLEGPLDPERFHRALQTLVDAHPILRTSFVWDGVEEPLQVVHRSARLPFAFHDLSGVDVPEESELRRRFLAAEWADGFDLGRAPLMRLTLLRFAPDRHSFLWTRHNVILDGWSLARLFDELFATYAALGAGRPPAIVPGRPFGDYVEWLEQRDRGQAERFWRGYLEGFRTPTRLPFGPPSAPAAAAERLDERTFPVSPDVVGRLEAIAREHRLTLNTLFQGAWALVLARYTRSHDVVSGVSFSTRAPDFDGADSVLGLLVNALPSRARIQAERPLVEWLEELQEDMAGMRQFDYLPLESVRCLGELDAEAPLYETLFLFHNYPGDYDPSHHVPGLRLVATSGFSHTSSPLIVSVDPVQGLRVGLLYDRNRFTEAAIDELAAAYVGMLEAMAAAPAQVVCDLLA